MNRRRSISIDTTRHPNALGFLRQLISGMRDVRKPEGRITQEFLREQGLAKAHCLAEGALLGVTPDAFRAFDSLADIIADEMPALRRAVIFSKYKDKLFDLTIVAHKGADPAVLKHADVDTLKSLIATWLSERTSRRTVLVPCAITPHPNPRFSIGPVRFIFLADVAASELYPHQSDWDFDRTKFTEYLAELAAGRDATWLAAVDVDGCDAEKAGEIGRLAVDLAIVGIQVSAPNMRIERMARVDKMRGRAFDTTVSFKESRYNWGGRNDSPGLSIGTGYMQEIQKVGQRTFASVGNRVTGFTTGQYQLPILEGAWCDAAYWLQEGLSEPVDSIAVAKLETALEVLLGAESSKKSEGKILKSLHTFFGLAPDQTITPTSTTTAKQYAAGLVRDRSRVLHGTLSTLDSDLVETRDSLQYMGITLVRSTAIELDLYLRDGQTADDVDVFLDWIKLRRDSEKAAP